MKTVSTMIIITLVSATFSAYASYSSMLLPTTIKNKMSCPDGYALKMMKKTIIEHICQNQEEHRFGDIDVAGSRA